MEPDKYKKKYGWKNKQKLIPPSYICKNMSDNQKKKAY